MKKLLNLAASAVAMLGAAKDMISNAMTPKMAYAGGISEGPVSFQDAYAERKRELGLDTTARRDNMKIAQLTGQIAYCDGSIDKSVTHHGAWTGSRELDNMAVSTVHGAAPTHLRC